MSVSDDTAVDSEALPGGAGKSGGGTLQVGAAARGRICLNCAYSCGTMPVDSEALPGGAGKSGGGTLQVRAAASHICTSCVLVECRAQALPQCCVVADTVVNPKCFGLPF
jgi:hypothetical protein